MALKEIEYKDADNKPVKAAYITQGSAYTLTGNREQFARCVAQGMPLIQAYCSAYQVMLAPDTQDEINQQVRRLSNDTAVVLRIAELQKPVIRKLQKRIEYSLQQAFEQCQVAYDLAFVKGDTKGLLKAIELQANLGKLLSQDVNITHKYGVLDDAATEVLLEMRRAIESQRAKQKALGVVVEAEGVVIAETPHGPPLGPIE